jgi:hypothetical protein
MTEANLFPVIPHMHVERHNREATSMSDYVHTGGRSKTSVESGAIESRLIFGACYVLFLVWATVMRLVPWHKQADVERCSGRRSIFAEARHEAGIIVTLSFMGL